ncbi:MAG: RnfABCDGE type electron transport complex subunit G, partial [Pseudomonadota bacterium]
MTNSPDSAPTAAPLRDRLRDSALLPGLLLALFALVSALLLAVSSELTAAAIAQRKAEDLQASLSQVLPPALYENDPVKTILTLDDTLEGPVAVHRARQGEAVSAVAFSLIGQGYAGGIVVLMGIAPDGRVLGVRVLSHAETPGLGDKIEAAKSDWIL